MAKNLNKISHSLMNKKSSKNVKFIDSGIAKIKINYR